jgi:hypothetical protein
MLSYTTKSQVSPRRPVCLLDTPMYLSDARGVWETLGLGCVCYSRRLRGVSGTPGRISDIRGVWRHLIMYGRHHLVTFRRSGVSYSSYTLRCPLYTLLPGVVPYAAGVCWVLGDASASAVCRYTRGVYDTYCTPVSGTWKTLKGVCDTPVSDMSYNTQGCMGFTGVFICPRVYRILYSGVFNTSQGNVSRRRDVIL